MKIMSQYHDIMTKGGKDDEVISNKACSSSNQYHKNDQNIYNSIQRMIKPVLSYNSRITTKEKMSEKLESPIAERFPDTYFDQRRNNDYKRQEQFILDGKLIKKYRKTGKICDIGCSTGEFLRALKWNSEDCYGMEINKTAKEKAREYVSFDKDIYNSESYFDIIVMRGTLQHINIHL